MSMDRCCKCGDLVDTDECPDGYHEDQLYCDTCVDEYFTPCDSCGDLVHNSLIQSVRGEPVEAGSASFEVYQLCGKCRE